MKTNRKKETAETRPPIDECVACGAENSLVRALTRTEKDFRGETFSVEHHHWKCEECGVGMLGDAEMDEAMRVTVAAYQHAHGLLTADEIRGARVRMGWSQRKLAEDSGISIATIKRLELGGVVQTEVNDQRLRDTLGVALNGAFVFMHSEQFGVVEYHLSESWDEGWGCRVEVRGHTVALDSCIDNICPA
jgi:putative zinc finger/helix-turn-helix YgiT family protein